MSLVSSYCNVSQTIIIQRGNKFKSPHYHSLCDTICKQYGQVVDCLSADLNVMVSYPGCIEIELHNSHNRHNGRKYLLQLLWHLGNHQVERLGQLSRACFEINVTWMGLNQLLSLIYLMRLVNYARVERVLIFTIWPFALDGIKWFFVSKV